MKDKIIQTFFITLLLVPVAYLVFNIIKIIAMILFPGQILVSDYVREMGEGWVVDPDKDLWGIFIVWVALSIYAVKNTAFKNENKS